MKDQSLDIRPVLPVDHGPVEGLYPLAFPGEDLAPLVQAMWGAPVPPLMLVADLAGSPIGHIAFSPCSVEAQTVWLLGPLAIHPDHQGRGHGTALIRSGLDRLEGVILVLGDPGYYGRHGFRAEAGIQPPYPIPQEWAPAWQSLRQPPTDPLTGPLSVPAYWQNPALWGP